MTFGKLYVGGGGLIQDEKGCWMAPGEMSEEAALAELRANGYDGPAILEKRQASRYSVVNPGGEVWKAWSR